MSAFLARTGDLPNQVEFRKVDSDACQPKVIVLSEEWFGPGMSSHLFKTGPDICRSHPHSNWAARRMIANSKIIIESTTSNGLLNWRLPVWATHQKNLGSKRFISPQIRNDNKITFR